MAKKKHVPVSDQVLATVNPPEAVAELFQKEVKALEIVEARKAAAEAIEKAADAGSSEPADSVEDVSASPVPETTETPVAASNEQTDDTRAPLAIPAVTAKTPRKPIINWGAIGKQLSEGFRITGKYAAIGVNAAGDFIWNTMVGTWKTLGIIAMSIVAAYMLILHGIGWLARISHRSFMTGFRGEFIFAQKAEPVPA